MLKKKAFHQDGFTLIEVLVALTILTIIIVSFTTLFTSSYIHIMSAGNKSKANYEVQKDMESKIADEGADTHYILGVNFDGFYLDIPGGLINIIKPQGERSSKASAFLPIVVIIDPDPKYLVKIGESQVITVNIFARNANGMSVKAEYIRESSETPIAVSNTETISNNGVDSDLTLTIDDYGDDDDFDNKVFIEDIIRVTIFDDNNESSYEALYRIFIPTFLAAGPANKLFVSAIGEDWNSNTYTTDGKNIYGVSKVPSGFLAVGESGVISTSDDGVSWTKRRYNILNGSNLKDVAGNSNTIIAVGESGTILYSNDQGVTWNDYDDEGIEITNNINSVTWGNSMFVAVGDGILTSSDGINWTVSQEVYSLNSVASVSNDVIEGVDFVAVGDDGIILTATKSTSTSDLTWTETDFGGSDLKSVTASDDGTLVAVGEGGKIIYYFDDDTWNEINVTTNTLNSVTWAFSTFVAVGDNGAVLTSPDGIYWTVETSDITDHLYSVTGRD
ncbi:MAG: hypothetical protein APF76_08040 [Desulfitibacter sp. BRH_c19]|nr:MAG: hypothetical protein APF76_08040 [Desulfitibacter sp. BRH_c19]